MVLNPKKDQLFQNWNGCNSVDFTESYKTLYAGLYIEITHGNSTSEWVNILRIVHFVIPSYIYNHYPNISYQTINY